MQYDSWYNALPRAPTMKLCYALTSDNKDTNKWFVLLDDPANSSVAPPTQRSPRNVSSVHIDVDQKDQSTAYAVTKHFNKEDCFTGKIGKDIKTCIANWIETCNDLHTNSGQRMKFFHNIFDDDVKQIYRSSNSKRSNSFHEAYDVLRQKDHSPTCQITC